MFFLILRFVPAPFEGERIFLLQKKLNLSFSRFLFVPCRSYFAINKFFKNGHSVTHFVLIVDVEEDIGVRMQPWRTIFRGWRPGRSRAIWLPRKLPKKVAKYVFFSCPILLSLFYFQIHQFFCFISISNFGLNFLRRLLRIMDPSKNSGIPSS